MECFFLFIVFAILCSCHADGPLFSDLIAAAFTPLDNNGTINLSVIPEYARYLKDRKVNSVFVGGSTGESLSVSLENRKILAETWVEEGHKVGLKVIIHVGCQSIHEAMDFANFSENIGADGISAMSTTFFRPTNPTVLFNTMKLIADAAPVTPFLYYHIPGMTGISVDVVPFFKLCAEDMETFHGIKFSNAVLQDITEIQFYLKNEYKGEKKLTILFGVDEQFDSAYYMGVNGGVGSTYNYASRVYHRIMKAIDDGNFDEARELQNKCQKFVRIFSKYGSGGRYPNKVLAEMTMKIELGPPVPPYQKMSEVDIEQMRKDLEAIDYFDWVDKDYEAEETKKRNTWIIIGGTIGAVAVLVVLCIIIWRCTRKPKSSQTEKVNEPLIVN